MDRMRLSAANLLMLLVVAGAICSTSIAFAQPNVVVIMADDLGYRDASCYGCIDFTTPHIDALAADGVRCTSGYVTHPYCSPSRAGLLSGRYQQRFGHEHNPPYDEANETIGIDSGTRLLPDVMRAGGYATALVGKWHLGAAKPFRPAQRGFTEFYGFLGGGHHYFQVQPDGKSYDSPMWRDHAPTDDQLTYLTDDLTSEAEAFIRRHADEPFCLLLMYNAPHAPDHVTDEYMQRVSTIEHMGRRRYAALVQGVDAGVGRVRATLDELNLSQDTIVVFLSDNGGRRGSADNRPLRGNKGWLHEGGIRVPFIVTWPDQLPSGTTYDRPVSAVDLLPTAMAAADMAVPDDVDGRDIVDYLAGERTEDPHETIYWRVCGGKGFALRCGDWKLVHDVSMPQPHLYNLADDLGEDHDLAEQEAGILQELLTLYRAWNASLETPRWIESHERNVTEERQQAHRAGTRQFPMPWVAGE